MIVDRPALDAKVKTLLEEIPGLTCCQVCRSLNGKSQDDCYACRDFGNGWKRKRGILVVPSCQMRKGNVWRSLRRMVDAGSVIMKRERRPDRWMARGWDWMVGYYPEGSA